MDVEDVYGAGDVLRLKYSIKKSWGWAGSSWPGTNHCTLKEIGKYSNIGYGYGRDPENLRTENVALSTNKINKRSLLSIAWGL